MSLPSTDAGSAPQVLIVDAHAIVASSLATALRYAGLPRVATAEPAELQADVDGVSRWVARGDIVLVGLLYGDGRTTLPLIDPLVRHGCRVLVMASDQGLPLTGDCLHMGAEAVLDKAMSFEHLVDVLRRLSAGGIAMTEDERTALLEIVARHQAADDALRQPFRSLTGREAEVFAALVSGAAPKQIAHIRSLKDAELRRLQTRGSVRLSAALQGGLAVEERTFGVGAAGRQFAGAMASGGLRQTLTVWSLVALVLVVGSRDLLSGLPEVGQFTAFFDSPFEFLRHFASGWRTSGLGSEAPAPPAFALIGLAGMLAFGAMDLLQRVLVLGMLPLGLVGMHRLTAPLGSWRARLVGVVLYAVVPLPYDALAAGRWGGLVAYAGAPWILSRLLRATGVVPFGAPMTEHVAVSSTVQRPRPAHPEEIESLFGAEAGTLDPLDTEELRVAVTAVAGHSHDTAGSGPGEGGPLPMPSWVRHPGSLWFQAVALALLLAVVGAFAPSITAAALLAGVGLLVGGLLVGEGRSGARALAVSIVAAVGAGVLLVPWTLELLLPGSTLAGYAGQGAPVADAPGLGELLRFSIGPMGDNPLTWGLLAASVLPLVVGRSWRFTVAVRLWIVAMVACGISWALGRGWLGLSPPAVDVLLAPGAAALVLAAVLGLSAFEIDLPDYRFGWRQVASVVAAGSSALMTLPVVAGSLQGRWRTPTRDFATLLSWMPERRAEGGFRVLWAGRPGAIPLDGWRLDDGLAYATSRNGPSDVTSLWPASDQGATGLMAETLNVARRGETTRVGHLLAPMGVRYVAVPLRPAPTRSGAVEMSTPDDLLSALRAQIDLRLVESDAALVVYENAAWAPAVSVLPAAAVEASRRSDLDAARTTELAGAPPALEATGPTRYEGEWAGPELFFSEAYSRRWDFEVNGSGATHRKAFGWANAFTAAAGPEGTLRYGTSPVRYGALLLEVGLWVFAIRLVIRGLRRRADYEAWERENS